MGEDRLFSVVIPSYGGGALWKTAVDSVLMQDYPEIELIFSDDCTPNFNVGEVQRYIERKKGGNLRRFMVIRQSQNIGTVANLKEADRHCMGRYLTHIAMDDAYCSSNVLSQYAKALQSKGAGTLGVYANSLVCDEELNLLGGVSFDVEKAKDMNNMTGTEQFAVLAEGCCIHMGATAFIRDEFMHSGGFDEKYRLIEDWPYFLKCTLTGYRFHYEPFEAIYYRMGGITDELYSSPGKRACMQDHLRIYEELIFSGFKYLKTSRRAEVYRRYAVDRANLESVYGPLSQKSKAELIAGDFRCAFYETAFRIRWHCKEIAVWLLGLAVIHCFGWHGFRVNTLWTLAVVTGGTALIYIKRSHRHKKLIEGRI